LVFPEDSLVGKNHRSLPDTQMLRKIALQFLQLVPRRSGCNRDYLVRGIEGLGEMGGWKTQGDANR